MLLYCILPAVVAGLVRSGAGDGAPGDGSENAGEMGVTACRAGDSAEDDEMRAAPGDGVCIVAAGMGSGIGSTGVCSGDTAAACCA